MAIVITLILLAYTYIAAVTVNQFSPFFLGPVLIYFLWVMVHMRNEQREASEEQIEKIEALQKQITILQQNFEAKSAPEQEQQESNI